MTFTFWFSFFPLADFHGSLTCRREYIHVVLACLVFNDIHFHLAGTGRRVVQQFHIDGIHRLFRTRKREGILAIDRVDHISVLVHDIEVDPHHRRVGDARGIDGIVCHRIIAAGER